MTALEVGSSAQILHDGQAVMAKVIKTSPRIVTVAFYGMGGFGHVPQTFNRKTGAPTGNTETIYPFARLDVNYQHPFEVVPRAEIPPQKVRPTLNVRPHIMWVEDVIQLVESHDEKSTNR